MSDISKIEIMDFSDTPTSLQNQNIKDNSYNTFDSNIKQANNMEDFNFDDNTKTSNGILSIIDKLDNFTDELGCKISNEFQSAISEIESWKYDVDKWLKEDALPIINSVGDAITNIFAKTGATIALGIQSLVEGVGLLGESLVDVLTLVGTAVASIGTGLYDGAQAIYGLVTGNEWQSATKEMWNITMSFVSESYVTNWFDSLYNDTSYGKWIKENALWYETVRSVGSGIGYAAGIIGISLLTFGVGGAIVGGTGAASGLAVTAGQTAIVAGIAGIGKGTQDSWAEGATLGEGLLTGGLTGIWEGLQFYLGAKIGTSNLFNGNNAKILNSLSRITLDGLDNGIEGFIQPLIASIYKDGYTNDSGEYIEFNDSDNFLDKYGQIFNDYGSWQNVLTQAATGVVGSTIGEIGDLTKLLKNKSSHADLELDTNNVNNNLNSINNDYIKNIDANNDLNLTIRQANAIIQGGNFCTININDINEIDISNLHLAMYPNWLYFKTQDGKIFSCNQLKNIFSNSSELKKQLILDSANIDDPILKARNLYVELNKKLHYSMDYLKGDKEVKASIYNPITTFDNLNENNTIICKGWSELYKELLVSSGFDETNVKIAGNGVHKWIEINLNNGNILVADATEAIGGATDIASCKAGIRTNGFAILSKESTGVRLSNIYKESEINKEFINYQKSWIENIDKNLGYVGEFGYLADEIKKSDNLFSNSKLYEKLFGETKKLENIKNIFDLDIPSDMDGFEVYTYYNAYRKKILGDNYNELNLGTFYIQTQDMIEAVNQMSYFKDNECFIQIYSKSLGKIRFNNPMELEIFKQKLNLVR